MNPREIFDLSKVALQQDVQGYEVDTLAHYLIDNVYTKVFVAKKAGTFIGQHAHKYDHGTLVAAGVMRVFINGKWIGDFKAGEMIPVMSGKHHVLMALEDDTVAACIHNAHGEAEPAILEEAVLSVS